MATFPRSPLLLLFLISQLHFAVFANAEPPSPPQTPTDQINLLSAQVKQSFAVILEILEHCDSPTREQSGYLTGYLKGQGSLSGILNAGLSQMIPGAAAGGLAGAAVGSAVMLPTAITSLSMASLPIIGPAALIGLGLGSISGAAIAASQPAGKLDGSFEISGQIEGKHYTRLTHEQLHYCAVFDFENFAELDEDIAEAAAFQKKNSVENLEVIKGGEYEALLKFRETFAAYVENFSDHMISKTRYVEFVEAARKLQVIRQNLILMSLDAINDDAQYTSLTRLIDAIEKNLSQTVRFVMINVPQIEIRAHRYAELKIHDNGHQFEGATQFVDNTLLQAKHSYLMKNQDVILYGNDELIKDCQGKTYETGYSEIRYRKDPGFNSKDFDSEFRFKKKGFWTGEEYSVMGIYNKEWPANLSYTVREKLYFTASRMTSETNAQDTLAFYVMPEDEFVKNYGSMQRSVSLDFDKLLQKQISLGQEVFLGKL